MDKLAGSWPKMRSAESCGRVSANGLIYRLVWAKEDDDCK
jgi:hypothetical protein